MDKTLLILGAGIDQLPGILKAKEMGIYTIALDGNPDAKGKDYADEFHVVSIKHIGQIESFIKNRLKKKVDGVIAFGVDIPFIIAKTADMLGVNYTVSQKAAKLSSDKFSSKEFMKKHKIPIPAYKIVTNAMDIKNFIHKHGFPVVIKPVDNSASRGISYVDSLENLESYFNYAVKFSNQKRVQVEKYLCGPQISTESLVVDGNIYNVGFADRNYNEMDKFLPNIIENGGDMPSVFLKEKHKKELTRYLKTISKELDIQNGVIKGDIVIYNDKTYIIEFALRLSGGNFSTVEIPMSTGVDFLKISIKLHLGMKVDQADMVQTKNEHISLRYKFSEEEKSGIIKKIKIPKKNENIILSDFYQTEGEKITRKTTDHAKRLGFAIAKGVSRERAIQNAQNFLDGMEVVFE